ncbi:hypothetical protein IWQ61_007967 [Dispira simplex]|nr:hypothetical protein IWQ61_007967 [Dispira simplex]
MKVSVTFLVLVQLAYLVHVSPLPVKKVPENVQGLKAEGLACSLPSCDTFNGNLPLSPKENLGSVKVAPKEHDPPKGTPSGSKNPLGQTLALMDELNVGHEVPPEALPLVKNIRTSHSNDNNNAIPYGYVIKDTYHGTKNTDGQNMAVSDQVSPTPEDGSVRHIISQIDLGELGKDDLKLLTEEGILVKEDNDVILNFTQVEKLGILKPGIIKEDGSLPLENWQQIPLGGNEHTLDYLVEKSGNDYVYNLNHLAQLIRDIESANSAESSTTDRASAPKVKSPIKSIVDQEIHRSKPMLDVQEPNHPGTQASLGHSTTNAPGQPPSRDNNGSRLYRILMEIPKLIKEAGYPR